jgi:DNA polymerase III sliding clamp (beta) subunit (PCNA family)
LKDIGSGQDVFLVVQVDAAVTASGAATVTFSLESDSTENLATSATVHFTSPAIGKAALTAGSTQLPIKLPAGNYERYLGVRFTVATGPLTAGSFSAFLTTDAQSWRAYARNYVA